MRQRKLVTSLMQKVASEVCLEMGTTIDQIHAGRYVRNHANVKCRLAVIFIEWAQFFDSPTLRTIAQCVGGPHTAHSSTRQWYHDADKDDHIWAANFMDRFAPSQHVDGVSLDDDDAKEENNARRWRERNRGRHLGPNLYRNYCRECVRPLVVSLVYATSDCVRCADCAAAGQTTRQEVA